MTFSVIIPVYNVAPYLRACLDSVIAAIREVEEREEVEKVGGGGECNDKQSVVEIICVDDGSTDGSGAILDEYLEKVERKGGFGVRKEVEKVGGQWKDRLSSGSATSDVHLHLISPPHTPPLLRIIHQPNAGVSAARNAALAVAAGDWILFVDADDVISSDALVEILGCIKESPTAQLVAFDGWCFTDGELAFSGKRDSVVSRKRMDVDSALPYSLVWRNFWTYCYRCDVIPDDGFPPYTIGEDLTFLAKALIRSSVCVTMTAKIYGYRLREGSAIRSRYSLRKFTDLLNYSQERFCALAQSEKQVDSLVYRRIGLELTENALGGLMSLGGDERREAWKMWFEMVRKLRPHAHHFTKWTNMVMLICATTGLKSVAYVLCYVPYSLKAKGFHR